MCHLIWTCKRLRQWLSIKLRQWLRIKLRMRPPICAVFLVALSTTAADQPVKALSEAYQFTSTEIAFLNSFTLSALPALKPSKSNEIAQSAAAAKLGQQLFFDTRLSASGHISCASCHQPRQYFTDGLVTAMGIAEGRRNTPTLVGSAYSHWFYWDGRKDSLWSQALGPLEDVKEQGSSRVQVAYRLTTQYTKTYQVLFDELPDLSDSQRFPRTANPFGSPKAQQLWAGMSEQDRHLVNRTFANAGKALAAYQRQLRPGTSDFDRFVAALVQKSPQKAQSIYSEDQVLGMRLFMGRANCASCHNGPLFSNFEFHNVGVPERDTQRVDLGRYAGVQQLVVDDFNCLSPYSDAKAEDCLELRYLKTQGKELVAAFKAPSLRNVAKTAPYMHAGQFPDLAAVIEHYNKPKPPFFDPKQQPNRPHFDILPLRLKEQQKQQLIAFLQSLNSAIDSEAHWLVPPKTSSKAPSGIPEKPSATVSGKLSEAPMIQH